MNEYMDALWELKLRVDAYNEGDERATKAFNTLKAYILQTESTPVRASLAKQDENKEDMVAAFEFLRRHAEVQPHPDTFYYREQPERLLIDLRYRVDTSGLASKDSSIKENNAGYNLVKRAFGLPEYKEEN